MKALVVGLNWGHVHINAIRELGHTVVGVVDINLDKSKKVATQYSIEHYYQSLDDVENVDFDFISIAVPAKYHFDTLQKAIRFNVPIICEKPILGIDGTFEQFKLLSGNIFINYAYPFLQDINIFYKKLDAIKNIKSIKIICKHNLKLTTNFTDEQMFYETVIHPVALICHKLIKGENIKDIKKTSTDTLTVFLNNDCSIQITCQKDCTFEGLRHHICVQGDDTLELFGEYITGKIWHYKPIIFNKDYISIEHWPTVDPWYSANKNSISNLISLFEGKITKEEAIKNGAFNLDKAWLIEKIISHIKQ